MTAAREHSSEPGRSSEPAVGHTAHTTPQIRPFDESLPMALMRAREATMLRFRPILADHDLTEQQWRVLRALNQCQEATEVGALAETTNLLGPSLSRILVNLEQRNFIQRKTASHDQRRSLISLTAPGRRIVAKVAPLSEAQYSELERLMGHKDLTTLFELLTRLTATRPDQAHHDVEMEESA